MSGPLVSLVIPAYNEGRRLSATLTRCVEFFRQWGQPWEILVVDDGSTDDTAAVLAEASAAAPEVRGLTIAHGGKGLAVRAGMLAARGRWRMFTDADLAVDIDQLPPFLDAAADVAIGSREAPGARRIGEPLSRHLIGRAFNWFVQLVVLRGISDTQCGCKMFSAAAAQTLFSQSRLRGFGFDVEILYLARRHGLTIRQIPVVWHHRPGSHVRLRTGMAAFLQMFEIRWNYLSGAYGNLPAANVKRLLMASVCAGPALLGVAAIGVLAAALAGIHPLWTEPDLTIAEAAAMRDLGGMQRLIWQGNNPNVPYRVRAGILRGYDIVVTPLQASVGTRTPLAMQFLLANGAPMTARERAIVTCLAVKDKAPEILEFLDEGGQQARPDCEHVVTPW